MRLRILLLLIVLVAVFPGAVVDGCQALVQGTLDVAAAVLERAGASDGGAGDG